MAHGWAHAVIRTIKSLLKNRWQIPAAVAAVAALGFSLTRMRPPEREVNFDLIMADVAALMDGRRYYDAANAVGNLLAMQPAPNRAQQAALHERMAEIAYQVELLRETPEPDNAKLILQHQSDAAVRGIKPNARFAQRAAAAHEWLGAPLEAIESHKLVLEREPTSAVRQKSLQALVRLLEGRVGAAEQRRHFIELLLAEEGVSPAFVWWALQHAIQEALDREDFVRARWLLDRYADRFTRSDLKGYHDYLWAWLNVSEGRFEEAAPLIDWVDEWLVSYRGLDPELDNAGFLPAMNRWLRGRIELADMRPQEALRCFDDVLTMQSRGGLFAETATGRAVALAMLERHAAARREIHDAIARLSRDASALHAGLPRMRKAMLDLSAQRHDRQDSENAVAYLALALDLTPATDAAARLELLERLGRESEEGAERTADAEQQRHFRLIGGGYFEAAAALALLEPERHANLLWAASQAFDRAGRSDSARRTLAAFVEAVAADPRLAPAMLQLGQAFAADGQFEEAHGWYQRLVRNFPQLEWAAQARLLSADALLMLGPARRGEAEAGLRLILSDAAVEPQSQTYRDALFALCDLQYDEGRYAQAIGGMEDFLRLYPADAERAAVEFQLADAYRRSAIELRDHPPAGATAAAVRKESNTRFRRAADLFGLFDERRTAATATDELHRRLALLYHADCLFELNEPDTLAEALTLYRQAAAVFQSSPLALTAQVQVANVLLRQGKTTEAAQAVERARWMLRGISDDAFEESGDGMDRGHWDRYLTTVASAQLFKDVYEGTR